MIKRAPILILCCLFLITGAKGQDSDDAYKTDTVSAAKNIDIIGLPVVFYTPETKFGFGGGVQLFFNNKVNIFNSRLSNMLVTAIYTTEKQLTVEAKPQFYFYDGKVYLDGNLKYKLFPNSFWGIGNDMPDENLERYNMESIEIIASLLYRLPPTLNFGFQYQYRKHTMLEVADSGLLVGEMIPGSDGALTSGISFVFNFDTRDNIYSTIQGTYAQLTAGFSNHVFGGTYSYNKYQFDIREYIKLGMISTLALQFYLENTFGNVPFQSMGWLGGGERMRGFFRGRYMDDHMYTLQAEYRVRFHPKWIAAAFASAGEVASELSEFFTRTHFSYGAGLRFKPLKSNPTYLRFDFGINDMGGTGIYFGVNEAF